MEKEKGKIILSPKQNTLITYIHRHIEKKEARKLVLNVD